MANCYSIVPRTLPFSAGIAFVLATLFVKYRDIGPIWEVVMQAGMYATPIIYSLTFILQRGQVKIAKLMMLNPLAQIIQDLRHFIVFSGSLRGWDLIGHKAIAIIPYFLPLVIFAIGYYISIIKLKNSRRFSNDRKENCS